jgi:DNA-binding NtrC family response regulator
MKKKNDEIDFIMITAFATVETAVDAMKKGAADYITKPLKEPEQLRISVARVYEQQMLRDENSLLKSEVFQDLPPIEIIFAGMEKTHQEIMDVALTDATVLLYGETGTGKSLIAKVLPLKRQNGPFVDIAAPQYRKTFMESELFGYERAATVPERQVRACT